jgi:hypothetical protein
MSDPFLEAFARATYNPLLAATPSGELDTEILRMAPAKARVLCFVIAQGSHLLSHEPWGRLGELLLDDPEAARWALGLAVMLNHEMRHHVDYYGTALGLHYLADLGREYRLLAGAVDSARRGKPSAEWTTKLRRLAMFSRYSHGRFALTASDRAIPYEERPIGGGASLRLRGVLPIPERAWALVSVCRGDDEWAVSTGAILETRALLETWAYVKGRLSAAGHGDDVASAAGRLLFDGLDRSRDWYKGLFAAVGLITDDSELADRWWTFAVPLLGASWYALNGPGPFAGYQTQPVYRFAVALARLTTLADGGKWYSSWETLHERLAHNLGDPNDLTARQREWQTWARSWMLDTSLGDGQGPEHLKTVAKIYLATLRNRSPAGAWVDDHSGYTSNNVLPVGSTSLRFDHAPHGAREPLLRYRSAVQQPGTSDADLAVHARPLFPNLPRDLDPPVALYGS